MRTYYLSMLLALAPLFIYSQHNLTGTITDLESGMPLEQVTVYFPQLEKGTSTDADGNYTLRNLPQGTYKLVVSYMGYQTHSSSFQIVGGENRFDHAMQSSAIE